MDCHGRSVGLSLSATLILRNAWPSGASGGGNEIEIDCRPRVALDRRSSFRHKVLNHKVTAAVISCGHKEVMGRL
jgi:hypothetical protein